MLMHAIAHGGCTNTVRESAQTFGREKNPFPHREKPNRDIIFSVMKEVTLRKKKKKKKIMEQLLKKEEEEEKKRRKRSR